MTVDLRTVARGVMQQYGFLTEFSADALRQAEQAKQPDFSKLTGIKDLSSLLWSSIDNDDSRDLDQIEFARQEANGVRVFVGIAQVDFFVPKGSPVDQAAQHNTTSVYTGVETFPMLPIQLSTDKSSLLEGQKRLAVVTEMLIDAEGAVTDSILYPAIVQNQAQLTYDAVATFLNRASGGPVPQASDMTTKMLAKIQANAALGEQLVLQDKVAQALRRKRQEAGALTLEAIEFRPVAHDGTFDLRVHQANAATDLIEDFMVAANQCAVRFLLDRKSPTFRRVVRTPKRWDRIVALAQESGTSLPAMPDAKSLDAFLRAQKARDPNRFPDLSLAVIKLLGRGEYVVQIPGQQPQGHFSLAVKDYSHSTAPNRRYPDVVTQRLLLAAFNNQPCPYSAEELQRLATQCTAKEDDANKVERSVHKSIAALAMSHRIGEEFGALVTGASDKGTWVRCLEVPVEGRLEGRFPPLEVGDRLRVRLSSTDPLRGYIDFDYLSRG